MQPSDWIDRWEQGRIGFHRQGVHPDLEVHHSWFLGSDPLRILVPLCGKSHDLVHLADLGHTVVGVEIAPKAIADLFAEHPRPVTEVQRASHRVFTSGGLSVWCGDFFALPDLPAFDRVWDRAALVALPPDQRRRYVDRIVALAPGATLLLNVIDYDPSVMSGPPFPVPPSVVADLFEAPEALGQQDLIDAEPRWAARGHRWFRTHTYRVSLPG